MSDKKQSHPNYTTVIWIPTQLDPLSVMGLQAKKICATSNINKNKALQQQKKKKKEAQKEN